MFFHSKALNKMFAYNHKQSEWRELAAMKTPRSMFGAIVHNGKIVVVGGVNEEGLTASCEAYDFTSNKYDSDSMCFFTFQLMNSVKQPTTALSFF